MVTGEATSAGRAGLQPLLVDVAVVGGGVAGASVAAALATAGLGVAVIEREPRFRDRVRGESIHPWGACEADRLGLLQVLREAGANELPFWEDYADRAPRRSYCWANDTPEGHVEVGISHPAMQQALLDRAVRSPDQFSRQRILPELGLG